MKNERKIILSGLLLIVCSMDVFIMECGYGTAPSSSIVWSCYPGLVFWLTGKLGRAWDSAWVGAWGVHVCMVAGGVVMG